MRVVVILAALCCSCATTTKIVSDRPGATVTNVDDKKVLGKTPLTYESKMWMWQSEHFEVKAQNKKPKMIELKRSEVDVLPLVGGGCLTLTCCGAPAGIPIILAGGFKLPETTKVALDADKGAAPPVASLGLNAMPY